MKYKKQKEEEKKKKLHRHAHGGKARFKNVGGIATPPPP
jgi:hypothetical protein